MGETTVQDRRLAASADAPDTYTSLQSCARAFIAAQQHCPALPSKMDFAALSALTTPSFSHSFGPSYSVAQTSNLQGTFDFRAFQRHLQSMLSRLARWEIEVTGVLVDEVRKAAVVRAVYTMFVKGVEAGVQNEVVWWLEFEEGAEQAVGKAGWRVMRSTEIVDFGASGRIRELMVGGEGVGAARMDAAAGAE